MSRSTRSPDDDVAPMYGVSPATAQSRNGGRSYRWFVILVVIAILTLSLREDVALPFKRHDDNFNFLLFSVQTSPGYCAAHGHCQKEHIRSFWTIHGLWPSNDTSWPESCNMSVKFDENKLSEIKDDLEKYWPSVASLDNTHFWTHEWYKHGSCALKVPAFSGVLNYFNHTLWLLNKYNITDYLSQAGIIPSISRSYPVTTILDALHEDLRSTANIVCHQVSGMSAPVLTELRFCLSKDNQTPIDCKKKNEGCGDKNVFYLPLGTETNLGLSPSGKAIVDIMTLYMNYLSF